MNKSILMSIRPEHLINILNGNKTLELRKSIPKNFTGPVYIYCTKGDEHLVDSKSWIDFINKGRERTKISKRQRYYIISKKWEGDIYGDVLNGKVVARFWFDEYDTLKEYDYYDRRDYGVIHHNSEYAYHIDCGYLEQLQLEEQDVINYGFKEKPKPHQCDLYAWHINKLEIFDEPLMLSDFYKTKISYIGISEIEYALDYYGKEKVDNILKYSLKRAPQSWQYVYIKGRYRNAV